MNSFFFFLKKSQHGHGGAGTMGTALGAGVVGAALTGHLSPVSSCIYVLISSPFNTQEKYRLSCLFISWSFGLWHHVTGGYQCFGGIYYLHLQGRRTPCIIPIPHWQVGWLGDVTDAVVIRILCTVPWRVNSEIMWIECSRLEHVKSCTSCIFSGWWTQWLPFPSL
jgi:hypothetical protein